MTSVHRIPSHSTALWSVMSCCRFSGFPPSISLLVADWPNIYLKYLLLFRDWPNTFFHLSLGGHQEVHLWGKSSYLDGRILNHARFMGTPGPTVHARTWGIKTLKVTMPSTPSSLPARCTIVACVFFADLVIVSVSFHWYLDKWVPCLVMLTQHNLFSGVLLVKQLNWCILIPCQVVGCWWCPCLACGHVYALCDLSAPCCLFTHTVPLMTHLLLLQWCHYFEKRWIIIEVLLP